MATEAEAETRAAEQPFERLAARFLADPTVDQGTGFGSNPGLRVGSKIFAMLRNSDLVVKLPSNASSNSSPPALARASTHDTTDGS
jgi:hypothetical protein